LDGKTIKIVTDAEYTFEFTDDGNSEQLTQAILIAPPQQGASPISIQILPEAA